MDNRHESGYGAVREVIRKHGAPAETNAIIWRAVEAYSSEMAKQERGLTFGHRALLIQRAREHADDLRRYDDESRDLADTLVQMANLLVEDAAVVEDPERRGPWTDEEFEAACQSRYIDGLRDAIAIIQGESYPLSHGLARVDAMVADIQEEIDDALGADAGGGA